MIKYILATTVYFFSTYSFAEYPYETLNDSYNSIGVQSSFEVKNMSPTKSQDGIGLCYGFSATSLLENYRCNELKLNCLNKEELLSPIDVSSYDLNKNPKSVRESGNTYNLLKNLKASNRKIVKEECAKYSRLVHKTSERFVPDEGQGWRYLIDIWNNYKNKPAAKVDTIVSCTAQTIKSQMSDLNVSTDQIKDALKNANSLENFLYKVVLPTECLEAAKLASIPDFEVESYPKWREPFNSKKLADKIEMVLMNNIPLEMSICTIEATANNCTDNERHAITLFGIREVCSPLEGKCKTMVRVKNSYGWRWQTEHNDGWIDMETLIHASEANEDFGNITWIKKPGKILENIKLTRATNPTYNSNQQPIRTQPISDKKLIFKTPEKWKNYKGIWKCPNKTYLDHYEEGCTPFSL